MQWTDSGSGIGVFPMKGCTDNISIARNVNEVKQIKDYKFEAKESICDTNITS